MAAKLGGVVEALGHHRDGRSMIQPETERQCQTPTSQPGRSLRTSKIPVYGNS